VSASGRRALLDECVPRRLGLRYLRDLELSHVVDEGWAGQRNGALLERMRAAGFEILVTVDRNLVYQQNVAAAGVAVIVLHAPSNRTEDLAPLVPALRQALAEAQPGEIRHLGV
jgi:rRNA-processing protein FCF1